VTAHGIAVVTPVINGHCPAYGIGLLSQLRRQPIPGYDGVCVGKRQPACPRFECFGSTNRPRYSHVANVDHDADCSERSCDFRSSVGATVGYDDNYYLLTIQFGGLSSGLH